MKIIDAHAHIFPDKIADKAVDAIGDFYNLSKMSHKGTAEALIESGAKIGVSKYLVFSTATKPDQVESINRYINSECKKHSEFIGLGTMHPDYSDFAKEIEFLKQKGIRGIKLHPDFQKFAIDDERLYPLYDLLSEKNMFVLTHSGDRRYSYSNPFRVEKIAKMFPNLNIIAAHFGGWSEWEEAIRRLNLENVYFDTSSTLGFGAKEAALRMIDSFDKTHFFFGTDFPMWDHERELELFMSLKLNDKLTEDILYNNFAEFYGLKEM